MTRHSGFLLKQCDALNFRAVLMREAGNPAEAIANATTAFGIAARCAYYWGRHEALRQLIAAYTAAKKPTDAAEWTKAERALAEQMKPEIAKAVAINQDHDKAMAKLYGKKKRKK